MTSVPTVYLVGIDQLDDVPGYLELGAIVVVAPDRATLFRWQAEWQVGSSPVSHRLSTDGVVVDLTTRQVSFADRPIQLSDLEFRVFSALMSEPLRAWSFRQLRRAGWDDRVELDIDVYAIRALVQRLRVKLRAAEVPVAIESIRGFGFRCRRWATLELASTKQAF